MRSTDDPRRADGKVALVAMRSLPGQARPFAVTTLRPLSVVACEALSEADRLLASTGTGLAVRPGERAAALAHSGAPLLQK